VEKDKENQNLIQAVDVIKQPQKTPKVLRPIVLIGRSLIATIDIGLGSQKYKENIKSISKVPSKEKESTNQDVQDVLEEKLETVKTVVDDAVKKTSDSVKAASKKASDAAIKAGESIKSAAKKTSDSVKATSKKANDAATRAEESIKSAAKKTSDSVKAASKKTNDAAIKAEESIKSAAKKTSDSVKAASKKASDAAIKAEESIKAAVKKTSSAVKFAEDKTVESARKVKDAVDFEIDKARMSKLAHTLEVKAYEDALAVEGELLRIETEKKAEEERLLREAEEARLFAERTALVLLDKAYEDARFAEEEILKNDEEARAEEERRLAEIEKARLFAEQTAFMLADEACENAYLVEEEIIRREAARRAEEERLLREAEEARLFAEETAFKLSEKAYQDAKSVEEELEEKKAIAFAKLQAELEEKKRKEEAEYDAAYNMAKQLEVSAYTVEKNSEKLQRMYLRQHFVEYARINFNNAIVKPAKEKITKKASETINSANRTKEYVVATAVAEKLAIEAYAAAFSENDRLIKHYKSLEKLAYKLADIAYEEACGNEELEKEFLSYAKSLAYRLEAEARVVEANTEASIVEFITLEKQKAVEKARLLENRAYEKEKTHEEYILKAINVACMLSEGYYRAAVIAEERIEEERVFAENTAISLEELACTTELDRENTFIKEEQEFLKRAETIALEISNKVFEYFDAIEKEYEAKRIYAENTAFELESSAFLIQNELEESIRAAEELLRIKAIDISSKLELSAFESALASQEYIERKFNEAMAKALDLEKDAFEFANQREIDIEEKRACAEKLSYVLEKRAYEEALLLKVKLEDEFEYALSLAMSLEKKALEGAKLAESIALEKERKLYERAIAIVKELSQKSFEKENQRELLALDRLKAAIETCRRLEEKAFIAALENEAAEDKKIKDIEDLSYRLEEKAFSLESKREEIIRENIRIAEELCEELEAIALLDAQAHESYENNKIEEAILLCEKLEMLAFEEENAREGIALEKIRYAVDTAINLSNRAYVLASKKQEELEKAEAYRLRAESLALQFEKDAFKEQSLLEKKKISCDKALVKEAILTARGLEVLAREDAISYEKVEMNLLEKRAIEAKRREEEACLEYERLIREADHISDDEQRKKREEAIRLARLAREEEKRQKRLEQRYANVKKSRKTKKKIEKSAERIQKGTKLVGPKILLTIFHIVVCAAMAALTSTCAILLQESQIQQIEGLWQLNFWPVLLTGLALTFLFQNSFYASAINGACWTLLSMANTIKIAVRDEPVVPSDLLLIKEAYSAATEYQIEYPIYQIQLLGLATALLLILGIVFDIANRQKIKMAVKMAGPVKCILVRVIGFLVCIAACAGLIITEYIPKEKYQSYDIEEYAHTSAAYNDLGFVYSFCHNISAYKLQKPEEYNKEEASFFGSNISLEKNDPNIHVIMVMNEAFSDVLDLDIIRNIDREDPLKGYKEVVANENAISGHIVVPCFAGGTANTEFDVITGMQSGLLSDASTTSFRMFNTSQDSVLRVLKAEGYTTQFMHPGYSWYYDRENTYTLLGADTSIFVDDMQGELYRYSYWVSDDYVAEQIEKNFEDAVNKGEWLCSMNVTIQNHMAYTKSKFFGDDMDNLDVLANLSSGVKENLGVYYVGLRHSSNMLLRLTSYFEEREEPVMLVFFGDHLPYLGDDRKGYKELGIDYVYSENQEDQLKMYETPYVIWCNDAGAKAIDFENVKEELDLPDDGVIQASYLGSVILDLSGHGKANKWFAYLSEARKQLPVTKYIDDSNEIVNRLKLWQYYKLTK